MSTLKLQKNLIVGASGHRVSKRVLMYASIPFGAAFLIFLVKVAVMPIAAQGYTVSVDPIAPLATPGLATSNLVADLNAQNLGAQPLGSVSHQYLTGRGTLVGFMGDNIQIFEYATNAIARAEASAIFKRAPRLATESLFHLYLRDNMIGLYFGHNAAVMQAAERTMGSPISATSS
jgi:hypothetical protein